MEPQALFDLLEAVRSGQCSVQEAADSLSRMPVTDLGFARLDGHRALRTGLAEVVYCQGKQPGQVAEIMARLGEQHPRVLATRATPEVFQVVGAALPGAVYHQRAGIISLGQPPSQPVGQVAVVTAGTADEPVGEEACVTLSYMGARVERIYDAGVAGIHRVLSQLEMLQKARAVVVVAGMDGALPSVVGGLVSAPVVAVPTSVGYGASFAGLAALLTMLNSCAPGVSVVNIDNGFGAAVVAGLINRRVPE